MIADPPFTNGYYVEGGNVFGHVVFEEAINPNSDPVEIGLKVKYRYWGAWIQNPETKQWCYLLPYPEHANPQCIDYKLPIASEFHRNEIDLGRSCHPFLYRNKKPRQSFSRLNKTYVATTD